MTTIKQYQKFSTEYTTIQMALPDTEPRCTELCTLAGVTYVAVPDGVVLPLQPEEITVKDVVLTAELIAAIKAESPHTQLIDVRIREKIRERYDAEGEMYCARVSVGALMGIYVMEPGEQAAVLAYSAYIESVRQWGRDQRTALGL